MGQQLVGADQRICPVGKKAIRRYPPEWEKQACVWLVWPHNEKEWGKNRLPQIKEFYKELISTILQFQNINLILADEGMLDDVGAYCNTPRNNNHKLKKIIIPNNDIWIRDYGPFFLVGARRGVPLLLDFQFNGWGGKFPPWDFDNNVSKEIALYKGCEIESYPIVLEGGAVEFSGDGILLTTKQCLLNKNRNQNLKKDQIELVLKSAFNIEEVIWLEHGLEGDHTDGHIDNVARFIGPNEVLVATTNDKKNKNYQILQENYEYFKKGAYSIKNHKLKIEKIPLPDARGVSSYANFIFVNGGVIVPTFDCKTDKIALNIFKQLFPRRKIIEIDCSLLIQEGGGLHCMTKQEAAI